MKKFIIYFLPLLIIVSSCKKEDDNTTTTPTAPAEFTITASEFANVGDTFYMARDFSDLDTLTYKSKEDIWDYSGLTEDEEDTTIYYSPDIFPAASDFPEANIAFDMNMGIAFAIKTDEMIEVIGFYTDANGMDIRLPLDDHLIMYKFPIKKDGSFSDTGSGSTTTTMDYNGFPVTVDIEMTIEISSDIKEEGMMQLSDNSAKCLSEYQVISSNITATALSQELLNQDDKMIHYNFYADDKGTTFVSVELNTDETFNNVVYLKEL